LTFLVEGSHFFHFVGGRNSFQRIHTKESFQTLISGYFRIEKQQFWIPKSKKNWIAASEEEVEREYPVYRESNNACFVLKKI